MPTRNARVMRAPRGSKLTARSWQTEAPLRMLLNNLDPEVAERPEELIVYGGSGRAARNWECLDAIVAALTRLGPEETLLIQSGKPVGILPTHADAPRVLIANSNLVAHWATPEHFDALERKGLMMYGQMTAGSWFYIGSQGIIAGTYETFAEAVLQHFGGDPTGRWMLTAGLGGMGGAQPLAGVMAGISVLAVECRMEHIQRRIEGGYLDKYATDLGTALAMIREATSQREPTSVALLGNAAAIYPELLRRGVLPDLVTDQTAAHDPRRGYLPAGWSLEKWEAMRESDPEAVAREASLSMAQQVRAMLEFHRRGIPVFDYGNNLRQMAKDAGVEDAFSIPGFIATYIRPQFCRGRAQFRWVALSGDSNDIFASVTRLKQVFHEDTLLHRWLDMANAKIRFQGLPARNCWLGPEDRVRAGLALNEMVRQGELVAPVAIGRDHVSSGSVASPNRESESMRDGSDAVADWPLLNAMASCSSGATWVSIHHGGGVGIGYSQHAGFALVCDGSTDADRRIRRVLGNDSALAVIRHADAGYATALEAARLGRLDLPFEDREGR